MVMKLPHYLTVLLFAVAVVALISSLGNLRPLMGDPVLYLDMASNGIAENASLAAPFAYRAAIPLLVGHAARFFGMEPVDMFGIVSHIGSVLLILACFGFTKSRGVSNAGAYVITLAVCFYMWHIKHPLYIRAGLDVYAYAIFILAFWLLLKRRFYTCLAVSGAGLLVKEFLLVPLLAQAVPLIRNRRRGALKSWLIPLGATLLVFASFFLLPRLLIEVAINHQYIDTKHGFKMARLIFDPLDVRKDLRIAFSYCAYWLPVLMLITGERLLKVKESLSENRHLYYFYAGFHFLLLMYGGTNIATFVGYSLVLQIIVLSALFSGGKIAWQESAAVIAAVFLFNRIGFPIPSPAEDLAFYMQYYDGFQGKKLSTRTMLRFGEIACYIGGMWLLRKAIAAAKNKPPAT